MTEEVGEVTFISSFEELWTTMVTYSILCLFINYLIAGVINFRVLKNANYIWVSILFSIIGTAHGFIITSFSSLIISAIYVSIPLSLAADQALGFGIGQAILILYFHSGRAGDYIYSG